MQLQYFTPKNKLLARYMEGYYFLEKERDEPALDYLTFPNNFSIISVLADADIQFAGNDVHISEKAEGDFTSQLICHYEKPIRIRYEGRVKEITFYFKPLGLNAFIDRPLQQYLGDSFRSFLPFEDYEAVMKSILAEDSLEEQRNSLEKYWLSKFLGFEHQLLQHILSDLADNTQEYAIAQLAAKYHTSRQNISRLFGLHVGKTPSEFKKIQRFRQTMSKNMNGRNLTTLGYDNSFYDQSHLIRDFKSFTGLTPKSFFRSISLQENATINWLFL